MSIVSKTVCDACKREIDHTAQRWYSVQTITRSAPEGKAVAEMQHACDPDCFEQLLARAQKMNATDAANMRTVKAKAAAEKR